MEVDGGVDQVKDRCVVIVAGGAVGGQVVL